MLEVKKSIFDDIVIHFYPASPYIVKAQINFRRDRQVWQSIVIKDVNAALDYIARHEFCADLPYRVITHKNY